MQQTMVIMQGVPGVGKSYIANTIWHAFPTKSFAGSYIFSTDDYFWDGDGVKYEFKKELLAEAHKWNQERAKRKLDAGYSVIIDNTNIKRWQARPYVEMAVTLSIPVVFIRVSGKNWGNTHGVPDDIVQRMLEEMEELSVESCLQAKYPWEKSNEVE